MQNSLNCNSYVLHINIMHSKHVWNTNLLKMRNLYDIHSFIGSYFIHRHIYLCVKRVRSTKNLCSMTYLYFSILVFLLTYESTVKICHYVFHKKCHDNFLESCVAICLRSLSSSFWHFWVCVNEVFCPLDTSATLCLCMVEGGPLKSWGG